MFIIIHHSGTPGDMLRFSVSKVAKSLGRKPHIVYSLLSRLHSYDLDGSSCTTPTCDDVSIEFSGLLFHINSRGVVSPQERDGICEFLQKTVKEREEIIVKKLHVFHAVLSAVSQNSSCGDAVLRSEVDTKQLLRMTKKYFGFKGLDIRYLAKQNISVFEVPKTVTSDEEEEIGAAVHRLISLILRYPDKQLTGRTIARIFQGIQSPLFPALFWWNCGCWRKYRNVDFDVLCQIASKKLSELAK